MALPRLTYARVKSARTVNDTTLLDIAVQTESGEADFGEIVAGGYVTADSLIVGMIVGNEFKPMRQSGGSASRKRAVVVSSLPTGSGRFRYTVQFAEGPHDPDLWEPDTAQEPVTAYQPIEGFNGKGFTSGGIDEARLQGFAPVPLANGCPVLVEEIEGDWYIVGAQSIDGTCQDEGA